MMYTLYNLTNGSWHVFSLNQDLSETVDHLKKSKTKLWFVFINLQHFDNYMISCIHFSVDCLHEVVYIMHCWWCLRNLLREYNIVNHCPNYKNCILNLGIKRGGLYANVSLFERILHNVFCYIYFNVRT